MTDYQRRQLQRSLKHLQHALLWNFVIILPVSFLLASAGAGKAESQITGAVIGLIIWILTRPPEIKPPGPNVRDLRP